MRTRIGFNLFATAIAASAVAHALAFATFSVIRVGSPGQPQASEMTVVFDDPQPPSAAPEFDIGRPLATGYATHAAEGNREQVASEAPQDQPSLSLDPVGRWLFVDVPSAEPLHPSPPHPAEAPGAHDTSSPSREALDTLLERIRSDVMHWSPPEPIVLAGPARPDSPPLPSAPSSGGTGADPAPQSDSEVDAFSVLGSAQFRGGRVTVRSGRQVKTRRPKIGLAGMVDLAQRTAAEVVLKVAVDSSGKVTDVNVLRSSGSNEIDQPCRVAMYDWWFEPKKNATGHAVPDVFQFTISFR